MQGWTWGANQHLPCSQPEEGAREELMKWPVSLSWTETSGTQWRASAQRSVVSFSLVFWIFQWLKLKNHVNCIHILLFKLCRLVLTLFFSSEILILKKRKYTPVLMGQSWWVAQHYLHLLKDIFQTHIGADISRYTISLCVLLECWVFFCCINILVSLIDYWLKQVNVTLLKVCKMSFNVVFCFVCFDTYLIWAFYDVKE